MRPFAYSSSRSMAEALADRGKNRRFLAGGTDLLPLLKSDIETAAELIDIKRAELPTGIHASPTGISLGALTTLSDIATSPVLDNQYVLLKQAVQEAATVQIRNRATLGGNLLQRPRCWYFRNPRANCWLKGGDTCLAVEGCNEHHAVFNDSPCQAVHPSDLAGCLLALEARVSLQDAQGQRQLPLSEFFAAPETGRRCETLIRPDELLTQVDIPALGDGWRSVYLKAMDRKAWTFALAGIAVVQHRKEGRIDDIRIVVNGLATVPRRLSQCEDKLRGTSGAAADIEAAVAALADGTQPLSDNGYKIALARKLLGAALRETELRQTEASPEPDSVP